MANWKSLKVVVWLSVTFFCAVSNFIEASKNFIFDFSQTSWYPWQWKNAHNVAICVQLTIPNWFSKGRDVRKQFLYRKHYSILRVQFICSDNRSTVFEFLLRCTRSLNSIGTQASAIIWYSNTIVLVIPTVPTVVTYRPVISYTFFTLYSVQLCLRTFWSAGWVTRRCWNQAFWLLNLRDGRSGHSVHEHKKKE